MRQKTKAEIREDKRLKERRQMKGGTLAGQKVRIQTAKGYSGKKHKDIKIRINAK
ncbi:MAG: hypothetical protein ABIB97_04795 [Patescibacteria group bacterium]